MKLREYKNENQDLKWLIEAELQKPTFALMDTDLYELYNNEGFRRHFMSYEEFIDGLTRESLVKLLERVRKEQKLEF
jgi:hypothetical protein